MLKIEKFIPGGMTLATDDSGKKIFFWNALPGEIVEEYKITKNKSKYSEAIATKITNPSKDRVNPRDDCFLSTSPWQILNFATENKVKSDLVVESFREEKIEIEPPEVITDGKEYFYRNKMEYSLYYDNETNRIDLAFRARGSHRKLPIKSSSIERPEIFARATEIVNELNKRGEEARKYQSLLLRCNQDGKVEGGLYENNQPHPTFNNLTDKILGQEYSYSPNGFFQINLPVYELALKEIEKHVTTDKVLDLYSGVGTIGLSVAPNRQLTLVEIDKFAFMELSKNIFIEESPRLTRSGRSEAPPVTTGGRERVRNGNILALLDKSENVTNYLEPNQTVILDPPRAGCDRKLIDKLNEVKPAKIIYLSCNTSTQARDVKLLLKNYQIKTVKTFNFFPRTPHIENLVILAEK
ncbi:class I SAM-dependent RNA methyltransferase [Candidatus Saccharibacteria bacterium]|nr:class I SAM-dependent RNA methyltransferase [Candidatus Saccharibacteria bacterium]